MRPFNTTAEDPEVLMKFMGYRRKDGRVGIRNLVAVMASTGCINELPALISRGIPEAVALGHNLSCSHLGDDLERSVWTLANLAGNPNIYGVVLVGMGCEQISAEKLYHEIRSLEKPVERFTLKQQGDWDSVVEQGRKAAQRLTREAAGLERQEVDIGELTLGLKCGGSDTTSGLVSNPVAGFAADQIIAAGGTAVFTETPEILGAEHVLAKRAVNQQVAERILEFAAATETRIKNMGVDLRGSEPTPANIQGGLTTIEEKSLGAIVKAGTAPLQGALKYGQRPTSAGLYFMDGPARTAELMVGLAAAGCQLMIFSMGGGLPALLPMLPAAPARFPVMPVIKMSGNTDSWARHKDKLDVYLGEVTESTETIQQAGERLLNEIMIVASGKKQTLHERGTYEEPLIIQIDGPSL
jgi:altronate dehydratase large subunit